MAAAGTQTAIAARHRRHQRILPEHIIEHRHARRHDLRVADLLRGRCAILIGDRCDDPERHDRRPVEAITDRLERPEVGKLIDREIAIDRHRPDRRQHALGATGERDIEVDLAIATVARHRAGRDDAATNRLARKAVEIAADADAGRHIARRQFEQRAVEQGVELPDIRNRRTTARRQRARRRGGRVEPDIGQRLCFSVIVPAGQRPLPGPQHAVECGAEMRGGGRIALVERRQIAARRVGRQAA